MLFIFSVLAEGNSKFNTNNNNIVLQPANDDDNKFEQVEQKYNYFKLIHCAEINEILKGEDERKELVGVHTHSAFLLIWKT